MSDEEVLADASRMVRRVIDGDSALTDTDNPFVGPVAGAALSGTLARRFTAVPTMNDVASYLRTLASVGEPGEMPSQTVAEAIVRAVVRAETYLLRNIDPFELLRTQLWLIARATSELGLTESDLTALISTAERQAPAIVAAAETGAGEDSGVTVAIDTLPGSGLVRPAAPSWPSAASLQWVAPDDGGRSFIVAPRTVFGRYFRAAATGDGELQERWRLALEGSGSVNVEFGILALFLSSLDRRFPRTDLEEVAEFSKRYASFFANVESGGWPLETEIVVRMALAERDGREPPRSTADLAVPVNHLRLGAALGMVLDSGLTVAELDALIIGAEDLAARNGRPLSPADFVIEP